MTCAMQMNRCARSRAGFSPPSRGPDDVGLKSALPKRLGVEPLDLEQMLRQHAPC